MKPKSWTQKLNSLKPHEVKRLPVDMAGMKAGEMMLLPSPRIVDEFIRTLPPGTSMDVKTLRTSLAVKHGAEVTCPIITGFHLRTVAEAAYEDYGQGTPIEQITPFWRVLDERSPTTHKLSFGSSFVTEQRKREGLA